MSMREALITMAKYNSWMNRKLYRAVQELSDEQRKSDRQLYFKSIHDTLNHLLVVDRLWLHRLNGGAVQFSSAEQHLYSDFEALVIDRLHTDSKLIELVEAMTDADLNRPFGYYNTRGQLIEHDTSRVLFHVFNHQTHHRGQITAALSQLGVDYGVTDLISME